MMEQVYFEDVDVGMEIPSLIKHPTTRQLVMWAGGSGDFFELHYDKDFAINRGFDGVIVHGRLKAAFLGQVVTDWIGTEGILKKLTCLYRGVDMPDEDIICRGRVKGRHIADAECYVELDVWTQNPKGEKTTVGTAVVVLPARG